MSKWDEQILVVNRKELFNNEENHFYGFIEKNDDKTKEIINTFESYEVKRRGDMEEDPSFKQLIGYVLLKDINTNEVLVYKRLVGGGEARLHGKANDDETEVGQVHIGVVYECKVDKNNVEVKEDDTLVIKWMSGVEAKKEENYETWSEFLKPIF